MAPFKQDDAPRVYEIEQRLSTIQQGSMDVSTYYTELVTLWEEYKNYVKLPLCTCGKCECNAASLWEKLQQRSRVTKFLMGLNGSFESTRRHILMLKPIPDIEDVFNMVTQDERQRLIKPSQPESVVFQASGPAPMENPLMNSYNGSMDNVTCAVNNYRPRGSRPVCTHCGQTGHVIQKCFKLHGYPPGYIHGYKSNSGAYNQSASSYNQNAPSFVQQPRVAGPAFGASNFHPRGNFQSHPPNHDVANIMTAPSFQNEAPITGTFPYMPPPTHNAINLDLSQMNDDQVQSLIQQLSAQVRVSEPPAATPASTITSNGAMAPQSSSGVYSGLDDW